jgi:hypothetical protein
MTHIGYKAPGSLPGEHETLIQFKQLANKFFSLRSNGEKERMPSGFEAPGGIRGRGSSWLKPPPTVNLSHERICFSEGFVIYSIQYVANDKKADLYNSRIGAIY